MGAAQITSGADRFGEPKNQISELETHKPYSAVHFCVLGGWYQNPYNQNPHNHNPYCVGILIGFVGVLIGFVGMLQAEINTQHG